MKITDQLLIQIATDIAYLKDSELEKLNGYITLCDIKFKISEIYRNPTTGLDTILLTDIKSGESIMAFTGTNTSDMADILTDANLVGSQIPPQFHEANKKYQEWKENYTIKYVTGNSLGGGLSNYVAAKNSELQSVTYDPSPMPKGVKGGKSRNYIAYADVLNRASVGANLMDGVPGELIYVRFGVTSVDQASLSHVGHGKMTVLDELGNDVDVDIDVHRQIPFAIWGVNQVLSKGNTRSGKKVKIDPETLFLLKNSLETNLAEMRTLLVRCLDPVYEIYEREGAAIDDRKTGLKEVMEMVREDILAPLVKSMEDIEASIADVQLKCTQGTITAPYKAIFSVYLIHKLEKIKKFMKKIRKSLKTIMEEAVPYLLRGVDNQFIDGFVEELIQHHHVIDQNLHIVLGNWDCFSQGVDATYQAMVAMDRSLAKQIENGAIEDISVLQVPHEQGALIESPSFKNVQKAIDKKEQLLDGNYQEFKTIVCAEMVELGEGLNKVISDFETELTLRRFLMSGVYDLTIKSAELGTAQMAHTPYAKEVEAINTRAIEDYEQAKRELNFLESDIYEISSGLATTLIENNETILDALKPYINRALFDDSHFGRVQDQCYTSLNQLQNLGFVFDNINYQLAGQKFSAVDALGKRAGTINQQLELLFKQLDVVTMGN